MLKKTHLVFSLFCLFGIPLFGQTNALQIARGAENQLSSLLNKPAMVTPPLTAPLAGKGKWYNLELDSHIFTDQASFKQIVDVLYNLEKQNQVFDGKKSKMNGTVVSRSGNETIMDFVSTAFGPLNIRVKTSYRASVRFLQNTDTKFSSEIRQLPDDSESNKDIKNLITSRYAEEVTINGKKYTYIRIYSRDEVNTSILPNAENLLKNNSGPANEEALLLIIEAAKKR